MNRKYVITIVALICAILLLGSAIYLKNNDKIEAVNTNALYEEYSGEAGNSGDAFESNNISGEDVVLTNSSGEALQEAVLGESQKEEQPKKEVKQVASTSSTQLTSSSPYYVKINNLQNVVTVYTKDVEGNYTVPFKAMVCSTGTATPAAGKVHKVTSYRKRWNALQGNVYGQYATQIVGNILFHSVPYTSKSNSALEYWEYDKLGSFASLGCIRLTVQDAKWVYDNIVAGTIVEFYEDENPGPLGKPTAPKISDNERCRNWDPTDMAEGNPWREKPIEEEKEIVEVLDSGNSVIVENMANFSGEQEYSGE